MGEVRLIDADALKKTFENLASDDYESPLWYESTVFRVIDNSPTITKTQAEDAAMQYSQGYNDGFMSAKELITKEPERPKGKWIFNKGKFNSYFRCSNCGRFPAKEVFVSEDDSMYTDLSREDAYRFCFHCGADMRGGVE